MLLPLQSSVVLCRLSDPVNSVSRQVRCIAAVCGRLSVERASTVVDARYIVCVMCRTRSAQCPAPLIQRFCTLSYSGGRACSMKSSYLSPCTVCFRSSKSSRHSYRTKHTSSESWPGFIFVLTILSFHALLALFVWLLNFSLRAFHAFCTCPTPSSCRFRHSRYIGSTVPICGQRRL